MKKEVGVNSQSRISLNRGSLNQGSLNRVLFCTMYKWCMQEYSSCCFKNDYDHRVENFALCTGLLDQQVCNLMKCIYGDR